MISFLNAAEPVTLVRSPMLTKRVDAAVAISGGILVFRKKSETRGAGAPCTPITV